MYSVLGGYLKGLLLLLGWPAYCRKFTLRHPFHCPSLYFISGCCEWMSVCFLWHTVLPELFLWTLSFWTFLSPGRRQRGDISLLVRTAGLFFLISSPISCNCRAACFFLSCVLLTWACRWRAVFFLRLACQAFCHFHKKMRRLSVVIPTGSSCNTNVIWFGCGQMLTSLSN